MRTEFRSRPLALAAYKAYRRTWSPVAAFTLTQRWHAVEPVKRLAAAITLAVYNIPQDGVLQ